MFMFSFFFKYLRNVYYVPGIMLGLRFKGEQNCYSHCLLGTPLVGVGGDVR